MAGHKLMASKSANGRAPAKGRAAAKGRPAQRAAAAPEAADDGAAGSGALRDDRPADLSNIRDRIDDVDARIHALLNERARFAQLVGISKTASGKAVDFYRPEREADVLRKALKRNQGPLRDEEIARCFTRSRAASPISAWCPSRTPARGRSITPSICS
jgi:chorismate mutase-like protein